MPRRHTPRLKSFDYRGFYRVLRADDDTAAVMRYLLLNPVRAGLVERPLDYAGSGSLVFDRDALLDVFAGHTDCGIFPAG